MAQTLKDSRSLAIIEVKDWDSAGLVVLGLTVLERNIRQIEELGFAPVFAEPPAAGSFAGRLPVLSREEIAGKAVLRLRGDYQYPTAAFSAWREAGLAEPPPDCGIAVTDELKKTGAEEAARALGARLFAEFHAKTEGWIARGLNKRISFAITRLLVRTPVTPNQVTIMNFVLGAIGCLLLLFLSWPARACGILIVQLSSIADGCDGELATLKRLRSRLGGWLDTISDDLINNLMFVCLYIGCHRQYHVSWLLAFSVATTVASLGVSFFLYRHLIHHGAQNMAEYRLSWARDGDKARKTWFDAVKPVLKRDCFIFIAMVLVLLDLRLVLIGFFVPVWGAFGLYLASFLHEKFSGTGGVTPAGASS